MRPDQGSVFAGTIMAENAQMRLRHILEAPEPPKDYSHILLSTDSENFEKLKLGYQACMDVPALNEKGSKPLQEVLDLVDKAYDNEATDSGHDLTDVVNYLTTIGVDALTTLSISVRDLTFLFYFSCPSPDVVTARRS
jgi:endothelin-converting enzyme